MTSVELSKKLEVEHYTITRLIKKYRKYFNKLGKIKYYIKPNFDKAGKPPHVCNLNKKQQAFITVLLKNKIEAVEMKFNIVNKL